MYLRTSLKTAKTYTEKHTGQVNNLRKTRTFHQSDLQGETKNQL